MTAIISPIMLLQKLGQTRTRPSSPTGLPIPEVLRGWCFRLGTVPDHVSPLRWWLVTLMNVIAVIVATPFAISFLSQLP